MSKKGRCVREGRGETDDLVGCDGCGRWCYLEETPFQSVSEADSGSFRCNLCVQMEVVQETLKKEIEKERELRRLGEERYKADLKDVRDEMTKLLEEKVVELSVKVEAMEATWKERLGAEVARREEVEKRMEALQRRIEDDSANITVTVGRDGASGEGTQGNRGETAQSCKKKQARRKARLLEVFMTAFFTCGRAALLFRSKPQRPTHSVRGRGSVVRGM